MADKYEIDDELFIDPGFVHHRKIKSIMGLKNSEIIYQEIVITSNKRARLVK